MTDERAQPLTALLAILLGLFAAIFSSSIILIAGGGHQTPATNQASNFLFDLSFVGAALYFSVVRGHLGRDAFGYRRVGWRLGAGAAVLGFGSYFLLTALYASVLGLHGSDKLPSGYGVHTHTWALVATAAFVCVVAPVCEEFFFRGFLFGVLRGMRVPLAGRRAGPWIAALIVGLVFGLAHTGSANPEYLIPLGFLGFLLCIVRWRTGSLYPCMAIHSFNNCLALGIDELGWPAWGIALLIASSLAAIALVTGPLATGPLARAGIVSDTD